MNDIKIIVERSKDIISCYAENLEGIYGGGNTLQEAKRSITEAIELYKKYNLKIPIDYTHKKKYNTIFTNFINDELIIQNRANEIYDWMKNNNYDVKDTIIIDDLELTNFFPSNNFIFVKNGVGISNIL